jgi:hypothetical protein
MPSHRQEEIKADKPVENKPQQATASPAVEKKEPKEPRPQIVKDSGAGVVKSVLSGDTIVVINLTKNQAGPPTEKIISLQSFCSSSWKKQGK